MTSSFDHFVGASEESDLERRKLSAMSRRRYGAAEIAAALRRHVGSVKRMAREMGFK